MGYSDQANIDAGRASSFARLDCRETVIALMSFYLTAPSNQETTARQMKLLVNDIRFTFTETLMTVPTALSDFTFALNSLKRLRDTNLNDTTFQERVKQLEERVKNNYCQALEKQKKCDDNGHHFDSLIKNIYRPGMRNGRYPWDKANKRNLAVQTEEGLQAITKKFNNAIKKLNTSEVEVRFLSHGVQSMTSGKKDERPEVINPQFGMFSKHWIDANKTVLQESLYLSVNNRLYSRCEHCSIPCSSPAQDYKCPRYVTFSASKVLMRTVELTPFTFIKQSVGSTTPANRTAKYWETRS
ncbi:hypothetical protein BC937DRAFT_86420 [Endogone sp. FLAS-F59071]|nr:hypothetical protein BC937DRAFT_86420 [Endogone sp. FLAS-F59071]|eukprot:RUS13053.1 hypothetical protein BC937DRAFT_86420 [Endogone sp. FLAS-F59071]